MRANKFTKKIINKMLPKEIELLEFIEERETENPFNLYYHSKILYKGTIIYSDTIREGGKEEADKELIIDDIKIKIDDFEFMLDEGGNSDWIEFITSTVRVRYYTEEIVNIDNIVLKYKDWYFQFEKYVKEAFEEIKDTGATQIAAYDACIRNFKEDIVKRVKV